MFKLDVTKPDMEDIVRNKVAIESVSILVNNAAFSLLGTVEDLRYVAPRSELEFRLTWSSDSETHVQMETNYFGPLRAIRGALPYFRTLKSSVIINISSAAGLLGQAGMSQYCASKFALEGMSEALSKELVPFNIRVILADLGAFRTPFASNSGFPAKASARDGGNEKVSKAYVGTPADTNLKRIEPFPTIAPGDPNKAAKVIVDVVLGENDGAGLAQHVRLPLGKDAMQVCRAREREFSENINAMESIASSTNLDSP